MTKIGQAWEVNISKTSLDAEDTEPFLLCHNVVFDRWLRASAILNHYYCISLSISGIH